jgi:hypothetical protein
VTGDVLGWDGFLEPRDVESFDRPAEPNRPDRVISVVGVDHQPHAGPYSIANGTDHAGVLFEAISDFQLDRAEAFSSISRRLLCKILLRPAGFAAIEAGSIGCDFGAHRTAHQAVHGHAENLALQVPEGDVDPAQSLDDRTLLAVVAEAGIDFLPEPLCP